MVKSDGIATARRSRDSRWQRRQGGRRTGQLRENLL